MGQSDEHEFADIRQQEGRHRPAHNILLRCWREPQPGKPPRLRGALSSLSGTQLGAFDSEAALFALLHRILGAAADNGRPQDRDDNT